MLLKNKLSLANIVCLLCTLCKVFTNRIDTENLLIALGVFGIALLIQYLKNKELNVIDAGCIGLFSGVVLLEVYYTFWSIFNGMLYQYSEFFYVACVFMVLSMYLKKIKIIPLIAAIIYYMEHLAFCIEYGFNAGRIFWAIVFYGSLLILTGVYAFSKKEATQKIFNCLWYVFVAIAFIEHLSEAFYIVDGYGIEFYAIRMAVVELLKFAVLAVFSAFVAFPNGFSKVFGGAKKGKYHINLFLHFFLYVTTFGIWELIWIYRATAFTNLISNEYRSPIKKLLLCIFVPFYSIYWSYKTGAYIDQCNRQKGKISNIAIISLIMDILIPVATPFIIQAQINDISKIIVSMQTER